MTEKRQNQVKGVALYLFKKGLTWDVRNTRNDSRQSPIAVENTQNNATCAKLMVVRAIFIGYTLE
jgi:hypothetical protein